MVRRAKLGTGDLPDRRLPRVDHYDVRHMRAVHVQPRRDVAGASDRLHLRSADPATRAVSVTVTQTHLNACSYLECGIQAVNRVIVMAVANFGHLRAVSCSGVNVRQRREHHRQRMTSTNRLPLP